jgi:hypothetical protein
VIGHRAFWCVGKSGLLKTGNLNLSEIVTLLREKWSQSSIHFSPGHQIKVSGKFHDMATFIPMRKRNALTVFVTNEKSDFVAVEYFAN